MVIDIVKCAVKNIFRKRGRNFLTIIGIAIGTASVIIISNISNCGTCVIGNEINSLGLGGISISSDITGGVPGNLSNKELSSIEKISSVKSAMPVMMKNAEIFTQNFSNTALIWGIDSKANQIISLKVLYGRMINNKDINNCSNICLIDQNLSKAMYKRDNAVGKKISLVINSCTDKYEIVGIIKTGSGILQNMMGDYIPNFIYIPYTTMQNITGAQQFDQIAVKINEKADVEAVSKNIVNVLNRESEAGSSYKASNLVKQKDGLMKLMDNITIILSAVGAISLLVASLNIITIMLVSVNERKREIGIKKSIGAKKIHIMLEFLFESLLLTAIGNLLGLFLGMVISYIGAVCVGVPLNIRPDIIFITIAFSVVSAVAFGIYPAYKASKMKPVDALSFKN
ncbi:MAG: efflux ABC transporter, permease protein [Eubacteriales bacterium SKADARSKE-1]|nr:efflux ABC transporter, permease protein [Eubacteriales bacterium SKADARSKE-1]